MPSYYKNKSKNKVKRAEEVLYRVSSPFCYIAKERQGQVSSSSDFCTIAFQHSVTPFTRVIIKVFGYTHPIQSWVLPKRLQI